MNLNKILGFALGPIASALLGLISVPLVAWAFSPEDVGRLNIFHVVLSLFQLVLVLGLDQAYVREFHTTPNHSHLLKSCFLPGFLLLLIGALVISPWKDNLLSWLLGELNPWFYPLMLICIIAAYISRFLSLILRMQERGLAFSMSQVIPKAMQLLLLGTVIWVGVARDFLTLLWMTVASTLTVVILFTWNTREQWLVAISAKPTTVQIGSLLKFGIPLVISGIAYWGLTATSTLVLRSQSTLGELGIYSVTGSFAGVAAIFQSIFTVVWAPTVYKWISQGVDMTRVDTIARQALSIVCGIFVLIGMFSWLVDYVLPTYYSNVKYLVMCAIAPPLLYTLSEITCVGIGISRRTVLSVWATSAALATNVLLSLWLVPANGAAGAVVANAVAYVVFFVARTEASAYAWRPFPRKKIYLFVGLITGFAVATVALGSALPFHYALAWLATAPLVGWCFYRELAEMMHAARSWRDGRAVLTRP